MIAVAGGKCEHLNGPLESDMLAAHAELARLAGVPAPTLQLVYALIDLLTVDAG